MNSISDNSSKYTNNSISITVWLVLLAIVLLVGGVLGIVVLGCVIFFSYLDIATDKASKHGISEVDTSRLGGIAIWLSVLLYLLIMGFVPSSWVMFQFKFLGFEWIALAIAGIGLVDDFRFSITPALRLFLQFTIAGVGFYVSPELLPNGLPLFELLDSSFLSGLLSTLLLVGFVNAGNIADGANGLLGLILCCLFGFGFFITHNDFYWIIFFSVLTFTLFNLLTGKLFLGDFGAYSLSAIAVLVCFDIYNQIDISIWLFACLLSYPCLEISYVILFRIIQNLPIYNSDNSHTHNRVFILVSKFEIGATGANSLTGLLIALLFAVTPFLIAVSNVWQLDSVNWLILFILLAFVFLAFNLLTIRSTRHTTNTL